MAALTVLTGAHDVVAMLEQEPGLVECATKEGNARLWAAVRGAIEVEPARPGFLPKVGTT